MIKPIITRRSIRSYRDKPVEDDKIIQILESGRLAPSGDNTQPWHFIIVKSEHNRQKLAEVSHHQSWMLSAPVFIVCVADIRSKVKENVTISINEASPQEWIRSKT